MRCQCIFAGTTNAFNFLFIFFSVTVFLFLLYATFFFKRRKREGIRQKHSFHNITVIDVFSLPFVMLILLTFFNVTFCLVGTVVSFSCQYVPQLLPRKNVIDNKIPVCGRYKILFLTVVLGNYLKHSGIFFSWQTGRFCLTVLDDNFLMHDLSCIVIKQPGAGATTQVQVGKEQESVTVYVAQSHSSGWQH